MSTLQADRSELPDRTTRLRRMEQLFHEALKLRADVRRTYLDRECSGDAGLRENIERLLAADSSSDALDTPAVGRDFVMPPPEDAAAHTGPDRIGPYKIVRLLGSGGIGHVWLARRMDEHFEKEVAIKLIKRGMDSDAILQRFRQERQVLARLEHPNIARLIDGGAIPDGSPYLIMEYVNGTPIDRYCRERGLSVRDRLKLFREVCSAVQYAHQNLVVHRDIKPSNILVDAGGRPKLLDFGIARVLQPESSMTDPRVTAAGDRLLTPEYASPEQIRGEPVTTASDVYALGVVLYELLTTHSPYSARARTPFELEQLVCERDPLRPSSRVLRAASRAPADTASGAAGSPDRKRLARTLRGDIDTILLKALEKSPSRRYASVEQLSEDIHRYLQRLPIMARPATWWYWTRRFVMRHTAIVIAGAITVSAILGGLVVSINAYLRADAARKDEAEQRMLARGQRIRAEKARDDASAAAAHVLALNEFLLATLATNDPLVQRRHDVTLRELLDEAGQRLDAESYRDQPLLEADLRTTLGLAYTNLKLWALAEPHLHRALEIRRTHLGPRHLNVADSLAYLARIVFERGRYDESLELFNEALSIRKPALGPEHSDVIQIMWTMSSILRDKGAYADAEALVRETLDVTTRTHGPRDLTTATSLYRLGWILTNKGDLPGAEAALRESLDIRREKLGDEHPFTAATMERLGIARAKATRYAEAESLLLGALEVYREALGDEHPDTSRCLLSLARFKRDTRAFDEAESLYDEVVRLRRRHYGELDGQVGGALSDWARMRKRRGDLAGAEEKSREALAELSRSVGDDHVWVARERAALADTLCAQDRHAEAEPLLLEYMAHCLARNDPMRDTQRQAINRLVRLYAGWPAAQRDATIARKEQEWREALSALASAASQPASAPADR